MKANKTQRPRPALGRPQNAQTPAARREQELAAVWATLLQPSAAVSVGTGRIGTGRAAPGNLKVKATNARKTKTPEANAVRPASEQVQSAGNQPSDRRRQERPSRASQAQARQLQGGLQTTRSGQKNKASFQPRPFKTPAASKAAGRTNYGRSGNLPIMMALMMAGTLGTAAAQGISTSLPLTSVGDKLLWSVGDQTLTLNVPVSGKVKLELYSPQLDPADYRADSYYGDETYDAQAVGTKFELLDASGTVVAQREYAPGAQTWDTLFDQALPAGSYRLRASTSGNGKNTFALRLSGSSASVSAERLAVNVHSAAFVPVLNVTTDGAGYALQMYDGDGTTELQAQLRDASGKVYPLMVSGQRGNVSLPLPDVAGRYTVELRQPQGAKQYSNTVGFSLLRGTASRPITLSSTDTLGLLKVEAELLLPTGAAPTTLPVQIGDQPVTAGADAELRPAGTYPVVAPVVAGAEVMAPDKVDVRKGETSVVRVQVKPSVTLSLEADKAQVCVGDVVRFTARATTAYAGELPLDLSFSSDGLKFSAPVSKVGTLSADAPGELSLETTATEAGNFSVTAKLSPWADMKAVNVQVLPDTTGLQLRRSALPAAKPGDTVTVGLSLTNTTTEVQTYALTDTPGAGLEAQGKSSFSGTLQPGESRDFSYPARVTAADTTDATFQASLTGASVNGVPCGVAQTAQGTLSVVAPAAPVVPVPVVEVPVARSAPAMSRRSTVTLPFEAPAQARSLVVAHRFPEGAAYTSGSSRLNGRPIADPAQGAGGDVYWTLPASSVNAGLQAGAASGQQTGVVSYELTHTAELPALERPALLARYDRERQEVLQGRFDAADYLAAQPLAGSQAEVASENAGSIKLPLAGTVFRDRDRILVAVEGPLDGTLTPTINGKPLSERQIGTRTADSGTNTQRLEYLGIPLVPGKNVITLGDQTENVYYAGPTVSVSVTPVNLVADGSTPIRLRVKALDAAGQGSAERYLTLASNLEPQTADASGNDAGYQIALVDGVGELVLQPQATPTVLNLGVLVGGKVQASSYQIVPDSSRVGVGVVSATVGFNGGFQTSDILLQARAYYEGPLLGGKLYVAADKDGLPTTTNPYLRYPSFGDNSVEAVPLQGIDPVAVSYDHPAFHAQYRQGALPITVFSLGDNLTALSGYSKTNPSVAAFAAFIPGDLKSEALIPNGTRLLRLKVGGLVQDSESLQLIASRNGQELKRSSLTRYVDYTLDPATGVITLTRGLERLDAGLNDLSILASYRLADPNAGRTLGYGAEARYLGQNFGVGVAAVSLDGQLTTGTRAVYDDGTVKAGVLAAYAGGVQLSADLSAAFGDTTATAQARYQSSGYVGVNGFSAGANVLANVTTRLGSNLGATLDAEYHDLPSGQGQIGQGAGQGVLDNRGGSVTARADYRLQPFSLGVGAKYAFGDVNGLGVVGSVGYHVAGLDIDLTHTQALTGNLKPVTDFAAKIALGQVNLGVRDSYTWGGDNLAALTLDTSMGNTNYAVSYELPTASGAGNRARFGVDTSLPLNEHLTLGLRGALTRDMRLDTNEASAGADLRFQSTALAATLGGDVVFRSGVLNTVLRGGVSGSFSRNLTLTADGTLDLTPGNAGARATLGYAFRDGPWNSLGYGRYLSGSLSGGQPELSAGASVEFHQPQFALRAGVDSRTLLNDPDSFTYQPSVSGTYYFTDSLGIGAWGRALLQPATSTSQIGYGLELSARALPGTWLSVGYNFAGFDGLSTQSGAYTKQGAYLRLDLTLDETELGGQK
ncbi:DUF11 domain-containing protein [Deinococcus altitudinis]|uniref:DUF11 domain-containing protein n=1 Tax=Deinococcus altitudinis TaxID=468914 RepID=UPI0038915F41